MGGSIYGNHFRISTWGESHGKALGVVIDGCPAGLPLSEEDIQPFMDRRKPGQSAITTQRNEDDKVEILSGVFEGKTTGTPISIIVYNKDHHSTDYSNIANVFRPGHADYTFYKKYGLRDYRGGGRSSARETVARVAAGAVASKILKTLGISVNAYTKSIADIEIDYNNFNLDERNNNIVCMPDAEAAEKSVEFLKQQMADMDSAGGVVECVATNVFAGIGEPVFDKLDAKLAQALMSIGAVKGVEIGEGFNASKLPGSVDNDAFKVDNDVISKTSNHAGGILGGISDGSPIVVRAGIKATPSIAKTQSTANEAGENIDINIKGRHDPVVVPRAVVVVESMVCLTLVDLIFASMTSRMDNIIDFFNNRD